MACRAPNAPAAWSRRWPWSGWRASAGGCRTVSPAGSGSAWRWPAPWSSARACCCSMNRSARWTPTCASAPASSCVPCNARRGPPSSW
ncbi:hypothetical protein [Teichococcus aestuarii]|uniref:hypothetical protein n=1 Tax=Teichococcus aestuarii TaxID=568898 RepID=UPI00360BF0AA